VVPADLKLGLTGRRPLERVREHRVESLSARAEVVTEEPYQGKVGRTWYTKCDQLSNIAFREEIIGPDDDATLDIDSKIIERGRERSRAQAQYDANVADPSPPQSVLDQIEKNRIVAPARTSTVTSRTKHAWIRIFASSVSASAWEISSHPLAWTKRTRRW
jgi:hypothetical protein